MHTIQVIISSPVFTLFSNVSVHELLNEVPNPLLTAFENSADTDGQSLIQHSALKYCSLNPMPSHLVSKCQPLLPIITTIINKSLQNGSFPEYWKEALVHPALNKSGMDILFENFRPVSNLLFISKLTEKDL